MQVIFQKLFEDSKQPVYSSEGAGCFDFFARVELPTVCAEARVIGTGIALQIPDDYVLLLFSRSGHGFKNDIRLANCVGVIDSDFRGEIMVKLKKDSIDLNTLQINNGDRIAQGIIMPRTKIEFVEAKELNTTKRGKNGFGSTGV